MHLVMTRVVYSCIGIIHNSREKTAWNRYIMNIDDIYINDKYQTYW